MTKKEVVRVLENAGSITIYCDTIIYPAECCPFCEGYKVRIDSHYINMRDHIIFHNGLAKGVWFWPTLDSDVKYEVVSYWYDSKVFDYVINAKRVI